MVTCPFAWCVFVWFSASWQTMWERWIRKLCDSQACTNPSQCLRRMAISHIKTKKPLCLRVPIFIVWWDGTEVTWPYIPSSPSLRTSLWSGCWQAEMKGNPGDRALLAWMAKQIINMMQWNGNDRIEEDERSPGETCNPAWAHWGEVASSGIQVESCEGWRWVTKVSK